MAKETYEWAVDVTEVRRKIETGETIVSPVFSLLNAPGYQFSARLDPKGDADSGKTGYMALTVNVRNHRAGGNVPWKVQPRIKAHMLDRSGGNEHHIQSDDIDEYCTDGLRTSFCRFLEFCPQEDILNPQSKFVAADDNSIILRIAIDE